MRSSSSIARIIWPGHPTHFHSQHFPRLLIHNRCFLSRPNAPHIRSTTTRAILNMRVFLFQTAKGLFSSSGGYRSNLMLLKYLASRGHAAAQLCYVWDGEVENYCDEMVANGMDPELEFDKVTVPVDDDTNVDLRTYSFIDADGLRNLAINLADFHKILPDQELAKDAARFIEDGLVSTRLQVFILLLNGYLGQFRPTHVIFNDGLAMKATSIMPSLRHVCRICIVHTAEQLPFGPYAGGISGSAYSKSEHKLLMGLDGIWSVSQALKNYAREYGQLNTTFHVHHPWTYLDSKTRGLPLRRRNWDKDLVGIVNPCPVKGSSIFHALAKRCPQFKFAAWSSWGMDNKLEKQLRALSNVDLRPSIRDMEEAWAQIKVLLVPSLWFEAWGIVIVEAQSRGIPVIASDAGAIPEAKLGIPPIIHVNMLSGERNEEGYVVPEQDIEPWVEALNKLMTDKEYYEEISERARSETALWLAGLDETALERWLLELSAQKRLYDGPTPSSVSARAICA
ncbi:hypothetical protein HRR83_003415 [Exophiala dermatitidis]|nr:hypothetical protein HRR74_004425 [Exophiala dermatitidis]KAJ4521028.1 hypothetical protein HRR73_003369 [Exophiala dermatitidis]KAJ4547611.1 hypothetical protein HRR76_000243 [Exophiala dermatitidis]KAJ4553550.1 hypothetical protein HRR77_001933 [Exophiala dermatitidis]KAJ4563421.1 hypothetical protein HRR79_006301 [Exophiala dermatitidis]